MSGGIGEQPGSKFVPNWGPLSDQITAEAQRQLTLYDHHPSGEHWQGLRAIAETIAKMAFGLASAKFYLSSMATGMGKTTVLTEAVKVLTSDPQHTGTGIAIFVNYLHLVPHLIDAMGFNLDGYDPRYAVRTGKKNKSLNSMGIGSDTRTAKQKKKTTATGEPNADYVPPPHTMAPVLFMTQAKLINLTHYRPDFEANQYFNFWGKPRAVRIWDEATMPIDTKTLSVHQLERFAAELESNGMPGANAMKIWSDELRDLSHDTPTAVPLIWSPEWDRLSDEIEDSEFSETLGLMMWLGGRHVRVYRTEYPGPTAISYRDVLPKEFAPLLVLDANGQQRTTYQLWEQYRGELEFLPSPSKQYRNLTIHLFDHASGREAHRVTTVRNELVEAAVAAYFQAQQFDPGDVLFITRKPEKPHHDMETEVSEALLARTGDLSHAHFLTWGLHTATNKYKDIKHVVVLGVLQAPLAHYAALERGAGNVPWDVPFDRQRIETVRQSEIAHELFQAVSRSAVRKTVEGDCPAHCQVWIACSTTHQLGFPRSLFATTFPGAAIVEWEPLAPKLRGGRLKSDNRPLLVEALKARQGEWFAVGDFNPDFSAQMVRRYVTKDEVVERALRADGLKIRKRSVKQGRALAFQYRLEADRSDARTSTS